MVLLHRVLLILTAALLALSGAQALAASAPTPAAHAADSQEATGVALQLYNRELFRFRAASLGLNPEQRQRRAAEQLRQALTTPGAPLQVSVKAEGDGRALLIDGQLAFWVLSDDVDSADKTALDAAAERTAAALRQALAEHREAADWRGLGLAALTTLLAMALLWALLRLLGRGHQVLHRSLARRATLHAERLRLGGATLISSEQLLNGLRLLSRALYLAIALFLLFEWLSWSLQRFPYTRPIGEQLQQLLLNSLLPLAHGFGAALPKLLIATVIFATAHFLLAALRPFFLRAEAGGVDLGWLDRDTARPTWRLVTLAVWIFALAMAYPYLPGSDTEAFKGLSVLLGLMISLGASSIVGQAAAGLILMYTRTLRIGEFVRIGEHEGTVIEIGSFATRIRTGLGEELSLPNALITSSVTRNYSRVVQGEGYVVDTTVTIGYDTPWRQVEAMLKLAAARTPGILADPAPRVFQTALSDFYVAYRLVAQARPEAPGPRAQVLNALHGQIQDVFNDFGVQIMSPHYRADPDEAKLVPPARRHTAPAQADPGDPT